MSPRKVINKIRNIRLTTSNSMNIEINSKSSLKYIYIKNLNLKLLITII